MSKQKSLTSFFKPVQTKRASTDSSTGQDLTAKKPKLEPCDEATSIKDHGPTKTELTKPGSPPESVKAEPGPGSPREEDSDSKKISEPESEDKSSLIEGKELSAKTVKSEEPSCSQSSTQEVGDTKAEDKKPDDERSYSQRSTQEAHDDTPIKDDKDAESVKTPSSKNPEVLKDVTKDDDNKNNFTTPVKKESNLIATPLGMLSPLQAMARIKSQCAKTPALHPSIGPSWFFALQGEFSKPYFTKLSNFLVGERKKATIYPPEHLVWSWTQLCTIKEVKVVILGQDPYHGVGQAHGLCFSVQRGIAPPPSLVNIYKELEKDIEGFKIPRHGNLTGWAQQGVLLLNACLTVRANNANSHKEQGWENLTDAVIKRISDTNSGVVFLLWGSFAHKKGAMVNRKKHHVLQAAHPSPLAAYKGFFGCQHFSKCNALLKKDGKKPIDWTHLPLV